MNATADAASGAMVVVVALLLGLRHATDPDHLTAVSTLVLGDRGRGARRAAALGAAWGLGHAVTLFALGLPAVLFRRFLPATATQAAEILIGIAIVALGARLIVRWRRGAFHSHPHRHGGVQHAHPHVHELAAAAGHAPAHQHAHAEALGRSPLAALGIGLLHGAGGSAAAGALAVGAAASRAQGLAALAVFALGTAISMAVVSALFGHLLTSGRAARRIEAWIPALAAGSIVFGAAYTFAALR